MKIIIYILIGILVGLLYVFLCKVYEKYDKPECFEWLYGDSDTGQGVIFLLCIGIWPILLCAVLLIALVVLVFTGIITVAEFISDKLNKLFNKLLK